MAYTEPTHTITHERTGTVARVPLAERLHTSLASGRPLSDDDEKYVAVAFKKTQPIAGHDMSGEYVDYDDLSIRRISRGPLDPEYGEAPVRMGPGGVVLDDSDYGEE